jgi:DNA (cytosine-5)-methyltransferase 1
MGETYIKDNIGKRRLTPIECERLQGFTDNYTLIVSDTARYKLMGNAVTVPVVKEIFINLKKYLNFQE